MLQTARFFQTVVVTAGREHDRPTVTAPQWPTNRTSSLSASGQLLICNPCVHACVCVRMQRVCFASDGPFNMTKDKQGGTICKVNRRLDFIMQPLCQNTCFVCVWNQSVPSCKWAPSVAYRCHFHIDSPFCFCFHGSDRIYLSQMLFSIFIGTSVCLCVCPPDCLHLWCLICVFSLT